MMNRSAVVALLALISIPFFMHRAYAAPDEAQYRLEERCHQDAETLYKRDNPTSVSNVDGGQVMSGYTNHYSPNLNKCFMLLTDTFVGRKNGKPTGWVSEMLIDVNENREIGNYMQPSFDDNGIAVPPNDPSLPPLMCQLQVTQFCHSHAEWQRLITPFLGEGD